MRILSRLPERRGTLPLSSGPLARKRFEPTRSGAPAREPRELRDGLAPARGIALALGIGALAWLAILLAITL
jgi:hypothetical protein